MWWLLKNLIYPKNYIWVEVTLICETPKAVLVMLDNRKIWLPKVWILRIKCGKNSKIIKIKISDDLGSDPFTEISP